MDDTLTPDTLRSRGLGSVSSPLPSDLSRQASARTPRSLMIMPSPGWRNGWAGGCSRTPSYPIISRLAMTRAWLPPASRWFRRLIRFAARLVGETAPIGPLSERILAGIRREGRQRGRGQATGITFTETKFLVGQIAKNGVRGIRDAALFSLMSDCMLRISELGRCQTRRH